MRRDKIIEKEDMVTSTNPVVVGQFATVDLQPEVGCELVGEEMAGVTEVGLDVVVGPQEGDHKAVILAWGGPSSLVDHDPSHNSIVSQRNINRRIGLLTYISWRTQVS